MKKLLLLFTLLLMSSGICFYPVTSVLADEDSELDQKEIDISLAPHDILFAVNDMKPGDWAPRTLAVKNTGSNDFVYQMSVQNNGGKKLFNELMLEISVGGKDLYQGKLADFTSLRGRKLTRGSTENLDITIRFPEHLGNDFQGTDSTFAFIFTAEGKDGDSESVIIPGEVGGGDNAPDTTTDPTDEKSGSTPPDEPSGSSDPISPDEPSSESESVPPEESTNTDPPESSSTSLVPNLPSGPDNTSTAQPPSTSTLPATSTNIFNLVLFGSVLVFIGIVLMLVRHYRWLKLGQK